MKNIKGSRILVVDDTEINVDILVELLKDEYELGVAVDGEEALKYVEADPPDLILLDIMMPRIDGYQVLEELKSHDAYRHIPIIMISTLEEMESVVRCIELGAEDYLPKPFEPVLLRARIRACLEKKFLREKEISHLVKMAEIAKQQNYELARATEYVKTLLPTPITEGWVRTDWRFIPSASLGGDSFGYHWLDDAHFAMYLLDVSGHGVGAALLSVSVINVLRSRALPETDFLEPSQVLGSLNNMFLMEEHNDMYFTMWYGVYDKSSRSITYASAGHPPALLFLDGPSEKSRIVELQAGNLVVGAVPDLPFQQEVYHLSGPGRLYIFSDGVFEIPMGDEERWEYKDFVKFMAESSPGGQSDMDRLWNHVRALNQAETLEDDFSILEVVFEFS